MGTVSYLDPHARRCPEGVQVLHAKWGVCTVLAARGAWREIEVHLNMIDEAAPDDDLWGGERTVAAMRQVPVWELVELDPLADLYGGSRQRGPGRVCTFPLRLLDDDTGAST
ncbi:MAG: hypothetical protein KF778_22920 [Rhodocyclaceae bacterium]|nr:hypothetical protein [Rhodocyclaceae bacterium]